ncbi:MAG: HAD family hydrolase, partial [Actinomycetota bacterium]|nr:HAD family hydrolase [Actinomycetota bacterium]
MRYDAVFLHVDGTLLWVSLDLGGCAEDLAPYSANGGLTVERVTGPIWEGLRRHIRENIKHRTEEDFAAGFKRRNAAQLGIEAPVELLTEVAERRISFNPYPESEGVLQELHAMEVPLYVVSNWDIALANVLEDFGWTDYFEGVVALAVVGVEKPEAKIFEEALRASGVDRSRAVHVGNDPLTDV